MWFRDLGRRVHSLWRDHSRAVLASTAFVVFGLAVLTMRRVPTPFPDVQLYASIARARQLYGLGVPTVSWNSPVAVDHIPFYGPVFFDLAALSLHLFGVSVISFRVISLLGTLLFVASGAMLARQLSGARDGWLWSVVLLVMTPEVNAGVSSGAMHMLAVGCEMLALAVFIRGLDVRARGVWHGAAAGALLTLAALTTPRSYPFIFAFLCVGLILPCMSSRYRRAARLQWAAAVAVMILAVAVWATVSHGSPLRWIRYMTFILTHEDTDVAVLPSAVRDWAWNRTNSVTPIVGVVGGLIAAWSLRREADDATDGRVGRAAFALATTWIAFVLTIVGMNLTFTVGEYFALPLAASVFAVPRAQLKIGRRVVAMGLACLLLVDVSMLTLRYARAAATWAARDPDLLNEFVRAHVPPGSEVVGPEAPYFFPVERNGSRYRTVSPRSWADWARWVPLIEPEARMVKRRVRIEPVHQRYFMWPAGDDLPAGYSCVIGHALAVYHRPPDYLRLLGPFGMPVDMGYPESVLYQLVGSCPVGYDPTASQTS